MEQLKNKGDKMAEMNENAKRELVSLAKKMNIAMLEGVGYAANKNLSEEEKRDFVQSAHDAERKAELELRAMERMAKLLGYDVYVSLNPSPDGEPGVYIDGVRHWYKAFDEDGIMDDARNFVKPSGSVFGIFSSEK